MLATDHDVDAARRVLVVGVTGSGKSTLARRLAEARGVLLVDGDEIGWLPGWVQRDPDEQRSIAARLLAAEDWVLASAWSAWSDLALSRADLVVALDLPRLVSLRRLVVRTARRLWTGERVCNGNTESLRAVLSHDSVVLWHFRTFARKRATAREWTADPTAPPVLVLRSAAEVEALAARLVVVRAG
ncbi:AAA family ATPase [Nocardioides marmoribigeumensis]|uniref:Adenylate kinase family enzyme n=1 Tax=Nocardioides marmoribigeumensis TaxID=433649 RepID=A0ABU2BZ00_9ACTN|nr:AAA family ATPase [Nocardioides marmoribigeumensis]MDR7363621.1 adenylate kinase family enzyme [Nocardioides marmoribigeumensis]